MERSSLIRGLAVAFALLLPLGEAAAHKINTSYINVEIAGDGSLEARVSFDETDLLAAFDLDADGDGMLRRVEMLSGSDTVAAFLEQALKITAEGDPVKLSAGEGSLRLDDKGNLFLDVPLGGRLPEDPETLEVRFDLFDRFAPDHRCLVKLQAGDRPGQAVVLHAETPQRQFRLRDPGLLDHVVDFTVLGIEHIFLGYDHLMFLLALIAIGGRPLALVKVVTAFTVAHSITLILAALDVVSLPGRLVEAGIAFSIAYVAAENLWRPRPAHRWRLTFFFGLVHGFGFANVLRELGPADQVAGADRLPAGFQRRGGDRPGRHRRRAAAPRHLDRPQRLPGRLHQGGLRHRAAVRARLARRKGIRPVVHAAVRAEAGGICLRKGTAGRAGVRVGKGHGFLPRDVQVRDRPG